MGNTPPDRLGMTAGTTNLVRQLGVAFGSALGALVWAASDDGVTAFRTGSGAGALLVAGVIAAVAFAVRAPATPKPAPSPPARSGRGRRPHHRQPFHRLHRQRFAPLRMRVRRRHARA
ncbi:hypothetical protein ACFQV4_19520 [Streptomyces thermocarboxydus]